MKFVVLKKKTLLALLLLAFILTVSGVGVASVFQKPRSIPIYSVETDEKVVALSFDCAWGVEYTDEILKVLKDEGVPVTFFAVQFWVDKYPDTVKKIADAGHEFGTHSKTHPYMSKLSQEKISEELLSSKNAIEKITGKAVDLFRPPYGDYDNLVVDTAKALGFYTVQWDVDSLDWKDLKPDEIEARIFKNLKKGSIVLFHNNGKYTASALPAVIKRMKSEGYSFLKIGDLILRENYVIDHTGRQKPVQNNC